MAFTVTTTTGPGTIYLAWANPPAGTRGYEILWKLSGSLTWTTRVVDQHTTAIMITAPSGTYVGQVVPLIGSAGTFGWNAQIAPLGDFEGMLGTRPPGDIVLGSI